MRCEDVSKIVKLVMHTNFFCKQTFEHYLIKGPGYGLKFLNIWSYQSAKVRQTKSIHFMILIQSV